MVAQNPEKASAITWSAGMHVLLLLLAIFGLPELFRMTREREPMAISVDILPISAMSNVKPASMPKPEEKELPKEEVKPVDAPAPKPKPVPPTRQEKKLEEILKESDAAREKKKPQEKEKQKKVDEDLEAVLKSVEKESQKTEKTATDASADSKSKSDNYDPTLPLSLSEKDAIRSQFVKCWNVPAGVKDAHQLIVTLRIKVNQDGSVTDAKLVQDESRYNSDTIFRAAADSAIRAVWQCSPLKNLPQDKYGNWKDMELIFDPKEMLF